MCSGGRFSALLLAEGLESVLVVTADRAVGDTRYLPESLTVLSDGADLVAGDLLLLLVTGSRGWTVLLAEYAA